MIKASSSVQSAKFPVRLALSLLTGLMLGAGWYVSQFWLIWLALAPLIIAVKQAGNLKEVFVLCVAAGMVSGVMHFWWIISAFQRFTATDSITGLFLMLLFALLSCLWLFLVFGSFHLALKHFSSKVKPSVYLQALLFALIYFLVEFIRVHTFSGIVWDKITLVSYLGMGTYTMQLAPVLGAIGVGIIIAGVNFFVAEAIVSKSVRFAGIAGALFLANLSYGWAVLEMGGGHRTSTNGPKIAIITGNVPAETKWVEQGNEIISRMLRLVATANSEQPDLMIWPETALPWTFLEDDEILYEISRIAGQHNTQHIIGYLTESTQENQVYNSAYLIDSDAVTLGRYDKVRLLDFMEKASLLGGFLQSGNGLSAPMKSGNQTHTLATASGNARVMICNESLLPWYFGSAVHEAEFLVNMSNNSWFDEYPELLEIHFRHGVHRALEYRKDMVVSNNRGISGIINQYGVVVQRGQSVQPDLMTGRIAPNSTKTPFARFPLLMPILSVITLALLLYKKI